MKKTLTFILVLFVGMGLAGPSSAQEYSVADLNGRWSMHAFGAYDVRGLYYYGTLTVEEGLIVGDKGGAHGLAVADYTGGGFNVGSTGEIQGIVEGRSALGSIIIHVNLGWIGTDKNQITFIGTDQLGMVLIVTLIRFS